VDVGAAVEMGAAGTVQHEIVRLWVAFGVDEVTIRVIVKPAKKSTVVFLEVLSAAGCLSSSVLGWPRADCRLIDGPG
jgi:hypothetical protein